MSVIVIFGLQISPSDLLNNPTNMRKLAMLKKIPTQCHIAYSLDHFNMENL